MLTKCLYFDRLSFAMKRRFFGDKKFYMMVLAVALQQIRSVCAEHFLDGCIEVLAVDYGSARNVVACGNLLVIGIEHRCERVALVEEHILPLANVAEEVVVQENHLHWNAVLHDGSQLLNGHLEASVATEQANSPVPQKIL